MTTDRKHLGIAFGLMACAVGLHAYEQSVLSRDTSVSYFLLWSMTPYILCLVVLILSRSALHVIVGVSAALVLDAVMYYSVLYSSSSTAVLGLVWMPIWNIFVFVPGAMMITWLIVRRRKVS